MCWECRDTAISSCSLATLKGVPLWCAAARSLPCVMHMSILSCRLFLHQQHAPCRLRTPATRRYCWPRSPHPAQTCSTSSQRQGHIPPSPHCLSAPLLRRLHWQHFTCAHKRTDRCNDAGHGHCRMASSACAAPRPAGGTCRRVSGGPVACASTMPTLASGSNGR